MAEPGPKSIFDIEPDEAEEARLDSAADAEIGAGPHRGRIVPGTDKRDLVTTYPTIIRYRIVGNVDRILRVRHSPRRPANP